MDHLTGLDRQRYRDAAHLGEIGPNLLGQYVLRVAAGRLGDV